MKSLRYLFATHLLLTVFIAQGMEKPTPESTIATIVATLRGLGDPQPMESLQVPIASSSNILDVIDTAKKRNEKQRKEKELELQNRLASKELLRYQGRFTLDEFLRQQDFLIKLLKQQKFQKQQKEALSNSSAALQAQVAILTPPPEMRPAQQAPLINGRKTISLEEYIQMMEKNCLDDDEPQQEAIKVVVPGSNGETYDDIGQMIDDVQKNDDDDDE